MTILLFCCDGQVGWELQRGLAVTGEVVALNFDAAQKLGCALEAGPDRP